MVPIHNAPHSSLSKTGGEEDGGLRVDSAGRAAAYPQPRFTSSAARNNNNNPAAHLKLGSNAAFTCTLGTTVRDPKWSPLRPGTGGAGVCPSSKRSPIQLV